MRILFYCNIKVDKSFTSLFFSDECIHYSKTEINPLIFLEPAAHI